MPEFQKDLSGQVSCRNRVPCNDDDFSQDWCKDRGGYCHYSAECRVPIPVKAHPTFEPPGREWLLERSAVASPQSTASPCWTESSNWNVTWRRQMTKKILEVVTLRCPCGKTTDYENTMCGAVNLGDFRRATGWFNIYDAKASSIWVCPACATAALAHAKAIVEILGSEHASLSSILSLKPQGDRA